MNEWKVKYENGRFHVRRGKERYGTRVYYCLSNASRKANELNR